MQSIFLKATRCRAQRCCVNTGVHTTAGYNTYSEREKSITGSNRFAFGQVNFISGWAFAHHCILLAVITNEQLEPSKKFVAISKERLNQFNYLLAVDNFLAK